MTQIYKALRNDSVNTEPKQMFGITVGTAGLKAKCLGASFVKHGTSRFFYEVYYPMKTVLVDVSVIDGKVTGSSNILDYSTVSSLMTTKFESEEFYVESGDWANINPILDHEIPNNTGIAVM